MAPKARCLTCEDCFFHKSNLCALNLAEPCPTFRPISRGVMVSPRQAQLIASQQPRLVPARAAVA